MRFDPDHPRTWAEISEAMDTQEQGLFRAYVHAKGNTTPERADPEDLERWLTEFRTLPPAGV